MPTGAAQQQLRLSDLSVPITDATPCVGRGAFSRVLVMQIVATGQAVAVKQIERAKIGDPKLILNEKAVLLDLCHPAIVKL